MSNTNPNAPPHVPVENMLGTDAAAEAIRREHLNREASVHAIGVICYLICGALLLATIFTLSTRSSAGLEVRPSVWGVIDVVVYIVGIVTTFVVGFGLRRLRRWARVAAIALSILGLMRIPVGTLICPYFLYVLFSAKGKRVFTPGYAAIVAATPYVKYPTSIVAWTVLAVVIGSVALGGVVRLAIRG